MERELITYNEISVKEVILKLKEWYYLLISKWKFILIAGIIGCVLGLAYAYTKKPLYSAELTFIVEGERSSQTMGAYAGIASQMGINPSAAEAGIFGGENLLAFMKSRLMIERALLTVVNVKHERKTLAEFYIEINNLREKWKSSSPELNTVKFLPEDNPANFSLLQNSLINTFHDALVKENLTVANMDKKVSILSLKTTSHNELFSKLFTEALAKEVSDFYITTKTKKSVENLAVLEHQADSVRRLFDTALSLSASLVDATPNLNRSRQALTVPVKRKEVDAQANQAMLMELIKSIGMAKMALQAETPLIQIIDRPVLPLPISQKSKTMFSLLGGFIGILSMSILFVGMKTVKEF